MVSILMMRMKFTLLRHSLSGLRMALMILSASFGLLFATGTIWLATIHFRESIISMDLLSLVFAVWIAGWIVGPLLSGDATLRPEHFQFLPLSSYRLALGLLGAAFVGVGPLVTALAFAALIVYALPAGILPVVVALLALLLQIVCALLLSKVMVNVLNSMVRSWLTRELSAMLLGLLIALSSTGWMLYPLLQNVKQALNQHPAPIFSLTMHLLPSGWGIVAVDAASRSDWLLVAGALLGMVLLCALLLLIWSRLLTQHASGAKAVSRVRSTTLQQLLPATPLGAAVGKELKSWSRDLWRSRFLHMAVWIGLFLCGLPVLGGSLYMLPWMGIIMILFAAIPAGNVYAFDGSAFWLTLVTPGTERIDVRGRQLAWLLIVGPVTIVLTITLTALSGQRWAWPWVLAITPALLGGAAGLLPLISIYLLAPLTDPARRGSSPIISGPNSGQIAVQMRLMLLFVICTALPTFGVLLLGTWLQSGTLQWVGVMIGIGTGLLLPWWLGRIAYRRLETHGPNLLELMLKGTQRQAKVHEKKEEARLPAGKTALVGLLVLCGILFSLPQGLVPLILKLASVHTQGWFVALYLPQFFQIPISIAFILLGLSAFVMARSIVGTYRQMARQA